MWLAATAALIAIFSGQELAEGWLASGHPTGPAGVLGAGGWIALVLAIAAGALVALVVRGAHALQRRRVRPRTVRRPRASVAVVPRASAVRVPRLPALATHLAGRAPPRLLGPIEQL